LAQYSLALRYQLGQGVEKDAEKQYYWYQKSAEQGNLDASYQMAKLLLLGRGVEQDQNNALDMFLSLAERSHPGAAYQLYLIYTEGKVVDANSALAKEYLLKSAELGHAKSQYQLGKGFFDQGVVQDALYWLGLAANQNYTPASDILSEINKPEQEEIAAIDLVVEPVQTMTNNIVEQFNPVDNMQNIAQQLNSETMGDLPIMQSLLSESDFESLVPDEAQIMQSLNQNMQVMSNLEKLIESARGGNPIAQHNLSTIYSIGEIVRKDNRMAFVLMQQSANQGITRSQNSLAMMYINGTGVEKDYQKAYYWASLTAKKGDPEGRQILQHLVDNFLH